MILVPDLVGEVEIILVVAGAILNLRRLQVRKFPVSLTLTAAQHDLR